ncbi:hypothetical protein C2E23DRAFT_880175 [Lenzites betulinus]|nr:hypothetical protein C2E23DRAFT_880175 [Lenzites betulinus]
MPKNNPMSPPTIPPNDPLLRPADDGSGHRLTAKTLSDLLPGVLLANKLNDDPEAATVKTWVDSYATTLDDDVHGRSLTLAEWRTEAARDLADGVPHTVATLLLGVSLLLGEARTPAPDAHNPTASATVSLMWELIFGALTSGHLAHSRPSRSSQGFLFVPLCSWLTPENNIWVLIRLHVWLADGERGNLSIAVHSHQPWTRSWILGGDATDHSFGHELLGAERAAEATHALYGIKWEQSFGVEKVHKGEEEEDVDDIHLVPADREPIDGIEEAQLIRTDDGTTVSLDDAAPQDKAKEGEGYNVHQQWSTVYNTQALVKAWEVRTERHTRDMSYTIPTDKYHYTEVARDDLHATLFIFDAAQGYTHDARVMGPIHGKSNTQRRDPDGHTTLELARTADAIRRFEIHLDAARRYAGRKEWESARGAIWDAIRACTSPDSILLKEHRYLGRALSDLSKIARTLGRQEEALAIYEELLAQAAVPEAASSELAAEIHGELGVVFRRLGLLDKAKAAFQAQYDAAKARRWQRGVCRAAGNLGIVNYQLWQAQRPSGRDERLLDAAIEQLLERIRIAQALQTESAPTAIRGKKAKRVADWKKLNAWEAMGLARLSLCYVARGKVEDAVKNAKLAIERSDHSGDPTVVAMSHFFYGKALLSAAKQDEALKEFNTMAKDTGACTPAMALCKVPSHEYYAYLEELVSYPNVNLDLVDDHGYSALDHAVINANEKAERIILKSIKRVLPTDQALSDARLKRGYRQLFHQALRPVFLESKGEPGLQRLRKTYAGALAADESKALQFDRLRFILYRDLQKCAKLPGASDGWTREYSPEKNAADGQAESFVFFSYAWTRDATGTPVPDDEHNTQYHRILAATQSFLTLHPTVNPDTLGLWIACACIDPKAPDTGVNALPAMLAQCNAMISLVDETYYSRAWCALEVSIVLTLRRTWGMQAWYVYDKDGALAEGRNDPESTGSEPTFAERAQPDLEPSEQQLADEKRRSDRGASATSQRQLLPSEKQLTNESERPKVALLEKQCKLLE